jgi:hypothetical protein
MGSLMSLQSLEPDDVLAALRDALAERILPAVADAAARAELGSAVEMLDNLAGRLEWRAARARDAHVRTAALARALGAAPDGSAQDLSAARREIADVLARAYDEPARIDEVVRAVAEFTAEDVARETSVAFR